MKIAAIQKDVLTALIKNPKRVTVMECTGPCTIGFCLDHSVGYIIPEELMWLDEAKIESRIRFSDICPVLPTLENQLTPTGSLQEVSGLVLRRFEDAFGEPVWIENALLKHFFEPSFYQQTPLGPVLVMETTNAEGEHRVGYIMPVNKEKLETI